MSFGNIKPPIGAKIIYNQPLSRSLVGFWLLNDRGNRALDISSNGNHGTLVNFDLAKDWIAGNNGLCLNFNGTSAYVNCPHPANGSLDFGTGDFTSLAWVKTSVVDSAHHWILDKGYGDDNTRFRLQLRSSNRFCLFVGGVLLEDEQTIVNVNKWYCIAGVRSKDNLYIYVNGIKRNSAAGVGSKIITNTTPLAIGARSDGDLLYWNGSINMVAIYKRALSPAEIIRLYQEPYCILKTDDLGFLKPPFYSGRTYRGVARGVYR